MYVLDDPGMACTGRTCKTSLFVRSNTMNYFELLHEPLVVEPIVAKVKSPDCGAVSLFVGTARNNFNGREVISLNYEAYPKMAHKEFMDICAEIRSKWKSILHIAVQHRLGEVSVSENIVTVALSSPHRAESLAAMIFILDKLKERVPIWKKENYKDTDGVWKENTECIESRTPCT
uniref:Molybdopterin synthase catalytic subunit n=1 Tax=Lygus hesperus TaxID=30085 RepID=A0A0A9VWC2_LYGHE